MRFALMIEPQQGLSYDEQLAVARTAEDGGVEALLRSDHYASFPGEGGLPTTDAWTVIAGLPGEPSRTRRGALVSPVTFRVPGALAKVVATADEMSGGRVEVGLGAGWNEVEHAELGIPFPPLRERFDRLEEALAIVHGLWTEPDGWAHEGRFWQVRGARFRPRPIFGQRRAPPPIVGGAGEARGGAPAAARAPRPPPPRAAAGWPPLARGARAAAGGGALSFATSPQKAAHEEHGQQELHHPEQATGVGRARGDPGRADAHQRDPRDKLQDPLVAGGPRVAADHEAGHTA